jgi:hypothetical protein
MTLRLLVALTVSVLIGGGSVGCVATRTPVMTPNRRDIDFTQEMKVGKSCDSWLLGLARHVDGPTTLSLAVEDGGLSRVEYVDESFTTVFLFWWKRCLIAYGH